MSPEEIQAKLDIIESIDPNKDGAMRHLLLAALISSLFAERGIEIVVVGGTALEFYTEGAYVSRDIDFANRALRYLGRTQIRAGRATDRRASACREGCAS